MRCHVLRLLSLGAAVTAAMCAAPGTALAQPSNDACASAQAVAVPSVTEGTLVDATPEPGPPPTCVTSYAGTPAVWYTLVGNGNTLTVETCSTAVSFDTKLHVYCSTNAAPCTSPVTFACVTGNDDGPTGCGTVSPIRLSRVTFCSTAGQTYHILVSTFSATIPLSPFTLTVTDGAACTTAATCAPTMVGACCSPTTGACTLSSALGVCSGTGVFQGAGTSCTFTSPCPDTGACCSSSGTCTTVNAASCTGTSTFQGVGTVCLPTNPCTALLGACCNNTTGACTLVTVNGCSTTTSTFSGPGTVCDPSPCPNVGSCCTTGGTCTIRSAGGCTGTSVFTLGTLTCTPNPCPQPGACCAASGCCTLTAAAACTGTFNGAASCTPNPCGAAPANDECAGAVAVTLGTAAAGGTCLATNSLGVPVPTCQATSNADIWFSFTAPATAAYRLTTCNSDFDTILIIYEGGCGALAEVECDDDDEVAPCNGLNSLIINRVLTAGTTYQIRVASFSTARGSVSLLITAEGALGSCCVGTACTVTDTANCTGTFVSGGTCTPDPCGGGGGSGACCCGSTCSITTAAACAGANTSYSGDGTVCNTGGNVLAPCCLSDYNQSGGAATVQDIFDFLSGYFGANACADINGGGVSVQDIFDFLSAYFAGGCT